MARVPVVTGPSVAPTALPAVFQTSNAGLASFGGTQADGLISSGVQLQGAGDTLSDLALKIQNDDNDRELKGLEASWRTQLLEINYGDGESPGFYQLRGQAAVNAEGDRSQSIADLASQLESETTNPAVRDVFSNWVAEASDSEYETGFKFTMGERIVANDDATTARLSSGFDQVALDPAAGPETIAMIYSESLSVAGDHGWDPDGEVTKVWRAEKTDLMVTAMVNGALSRHQPDKAVELLNMYASGMSGVRRTELAASLQSVTMDAFVQKFVDELGEMYPGNFPAQIEAAEEQMEPGPQRTAAIEQILFERALVTSNLDYLTKTMVYAEGEEAREAEADALIDVTNWYNLGVPESEALRKLDAMTDDPIAHAEYSAKISQIYGAASEAEKEDVSGDAVAFLTLYKDLPPERQIDLAESGLMDRTITPDVFDEVSRRINNNQTMSNQLTTAQTNEASSSVNKYLANGGLDGAPGLYADWAMENPELAEALRAAGLERTAKLLEHSFSFPVLVSGEEAIAKYFGLTTSELRKNGDKHLLEAKLELSESDYNVLLTNVISAKSETGITPMTTEMINKMLSNTFDSFEWTAKNHQEERGRVSLEVDRQVQFLTLARKGTPIVRDDIQKIIDNVLSDINVGGGFFTLGIFNKDRGTYDAIQPGETMRSDSGYLIESEIYNYVTELYYITSGEDISANASVPDVGSPQFDRTLVAAQMFYDLYSETPRNDDDWAEAEGMAAKELDED
jgi:hypothetical protein